MYLFPLLRGDEGVCYGEGRGVGGVFLLLFGEEAFLRLRVTALGFRWQCLGVTHPRPL